MHATQEIGLDVNFQRAALAASHSRESSATMWGSLCLFASAVRVTGKDIGEVFKHQEGLASAQLKLKLSENSTYKVAKCTIVKAATLGLSLCDDDGIPVAKTRLGKAIKALQPPANKAPKKPFEQLRKALEAAIATVDYVPDGSIIAAAALAQRLEDKLKPRFELRLAA